MSAPLLRLDQVSHRYGAVTALHPFNLTIFAGARHAVIGPNGAGKSTLLRLIAGSAVTHSGHIWFDGADITAIRNGRRARLGIGRTFQHPAIVDQLTAADNVSLAIRRPPGVAIRGARRGEQIRAALHQVGLGAHAGTVAGRLSYGQRRLLEFAVALAARPRLLLLDEPSAGLDPTEIPQVTRVIRDLPDDVAVIVVDHHLPLVFDLADTITVLAAGRHIATGTGHDIRTHHAVRDAYLSPVPPAGSHPAGVAGSAGLPGTLQPANASHTGPPPDRCVRAAAPPAPGAPARPVLQVDGLHAAYHGAPVLDQIALTVAAGSVYCVVGRNGAGKSTLLNTLAGIHHAGRGTRIRLDGTDLRPGRPEQAARHGVALVPQGRHLFASLTLREHLALAARHARRRRRGLSGDARWGIDDTLDLLPALRDKLSRYPAQLSGGEQQMAAIARALVTNPRLLLLDEPTEGLAPALVDQLADTITRIAADGVAVLLAEQNQQVALAVAHHLSVLEHGLIALSLTAAALDTPETRAQLNELLGVATAGNPT